MRAGVRVGEVLGVLGPGKGLWLYSEKDCSHGGCEQRGEVVALAFLKFFDYS